jgi:hypothetical protein
MIVFLMDHQHIPVVKRSRRDDENKKCENRLDDQSPEDNPPIHFSPIRGTEPGESQQNENSRETDEVVQFHEVSPI